MSAFTLTSVLSQRERKINQRRNPMRRKILSAVLGAVFLAIVSPAEAQQAKKVPRIGFLSALSRTPMLANLEVFWQRLRELGWIEGQNIAIEYRWAEGKYERLPDLAAELVRLRVDVIFANSGPAALAAKRATSTVPIVFEILGDPVSAGLVGSLARPGGNLTGCQASHRN